MSQTWLAIASVLLVLALIPVGLKRLQRYMGLNVASSTSALRIVSAVGVGPQQRVVTVEVGPEGERTWLTLGVTAQSITCLHMVPVSETLDKNHADQANSEVVVC
jgi:flagellar protein FliO/FliZ